MKWNTWSWILVCLVLFLVGDRLGGWMLQQLTDSSQFRYSSLYQQKAKSEILLVGNSRGLCLYQPEIESITNKTSFNLSYNGIPANVISALISDYFERYPAPELMLIDVTICDRKNIQLLSEFVLYAPYSERLRNLLQQETPNTYYASQFTHLFRHNNELFQRALFYLKKSDEDWLIDRVIAPTMVENVSKQVYQIDTALVQDLVHITKVATQKGTKVKLLINPYYPSFLDVLTGLDAFEKQIEAATGLEVYNYSRLLYDAQYFGDYQHLNKNGSKVYMQQLAKDGLLN